MFISDLFENADHSTTPTITEAKRKISASEDPCWSGYHMVGTKTKDGQQVPNCVPGKKGSMNEDSHMSDVVTARELIGSALKNTQEKYKYFDFLKHLRDKYGQEYSTSVHQHAAKLAKGAA